MALVHQPSHLRRSGLESYRRVGFIWTFVLGQIVDGVDGPLLGLHEGRSSLGTTVPLMAVEQLSRLGGCS